MPSKQFGVLQLQREKAPCQLPVEGSKVKAQLCQSSLPSVVHKKYQYESGPEFVDAKPGARAAPAHMAQYACTRSKASDGCLKISWAGILREAPCARRQLHFAQETTTTQA